MSKPLFLPLTARYYDKFANGEKSREYRRPGGQYNPETCVAGRPVLLSRGYGTQCRMQGVITCCGYSKVQELEGEDRRDVQAVYGPLCREVFWFGIDLARGES
jgi:hypothetical protein